MPVWWKDYAIQKQFQVVGTFQNWITGKKKKLGKKKFWSFQAISIDHISWPFPVSRVFNQRLKNIKAGLFYNHFFNHNRIMSLKVTLGNRIAPWRAPISNLSIGDWVPSSIRGEQRLVSVNWHKIWTKSPIQVLSSLLSSSRELHWLLLLKGLLFIPC